MLLKQTYSKQKQFSLRLTLSLYMICACEQALGATLLSRLDNLVTNLVTSDFQFEIEVFLEQEQQNWGEIAEKILVSKTDTSSPLGLLVANSVGDRDRSDAEKAPLSIRSVVETFKQLDLEVDRRKNAKPTKVPRLPQVAYGDIDKGVYVFEPTATDKKQSTNTIMFARENFASAASFGKVGSIGISGFSIATLNPVNSLGTSSLPQASGAIGITPVHLSLPVLNSQLSLLPQNQISTSIGGTNASVNNVLNALNSFGGLKIDRGFRLFPEVFVTSQLDIQDDAIRKSDLVRSDLSMISPLQTKVQERIERETQKSYGKQQSLQRSMYVQVTTRKVQYQQIQRQSSKKLQEQQQQQIRKQQARQERLRDKFEQQIENHLQRYQKRKQKIR